MDDAAECRVQEGRATRAQAHVVVPVNLSGGAGAYEQRLGLAGTHARTELHTVLALRAAHWCRTRLPAG